MPFRNDQFFSKNRIKSRSTFRLEMTDTIIPYDVCGKEFSSYSFVSHNLIYLGKGYIADVDGLSQGFTRIQHFWNRKN